LPLEGGWPTKLLIQGRQAAQGEEPVAQHRPVSEGYFQTMGIPLLYGRRFDERDQADAPGVVIINEALQRRYFPNEDPVGKRVMTLARQYGPLGRVMPSSLEMEIVGVVGNEKNSSLSKTAEPAVYFSHRQFSYRSMSVVVRAQAAPLSLVNAVQNEVWALDRNLPFSNVKTMEQRLGESIAQPRFNALLLGLFAALALLLAAVGVYGVISYSVGQRTREIGIRMALGESQGHVRNTVLREGLRLVLPSLAIGAAAAWVLSQFITTLLYQTDAGDPSTFLAMSAVLLVVALAGCYIPARRATTVSPLTAMRTD
jgi:putative ABC transport system permease protein